MSTVLLSETTSVIRLTPAGESGSSVVSSGSVILLSEVGVPGPPGPPGEPGEDGTAGLPEVLDGGNF